MLYKNVKILVMFVLFILFVVNFAHPAEAKGENITVTIDEGFDGKIKRGKGFPLSIKLENNGEAFRGDLLVQYNPSYNTGGALSVHVELPEGSSKTYQLAVPGLIEDSPMPNQKIATVHLYKDSWKKGETVAFQGDKNLKPRYIDPNEKVIGVLSENYDRLKELRILPSLSMKMLPLTKEQMPKLGLGLEMIDYLVIDEFAVSQLDEQQQLAIKEWILAGGVLVAGAAPDASGSYGQLYPILPMKLDEEKMGPADFLLSAKYDTLEFNEINLFTGSIEKGAQVLQMSGNQPAAVKKPFGNGTILQTSFSLGDQPLSTWKGYSTWFSTFIQEADQSNIGKSGYDQDFYDQLYWEFAETNEFFPSGNYSVPQLILILIVYLIVIVPILYFVLRKFDKREHSWWIIPSLAIAMSIVVFGLGAKDRIAEPQLNQMGIFKLKDGQLTGLQAATLLSNRSGEYRLQLPKGQFQAVPYLSNSISSDPAMGAIVEEQRKATEMIFPQVGYWSSKTIYGKAEKETKGNFNVNLSVKNNQLTGTIQNGFSYDFEEIFIWTGNEQIKIGPLKEGETLKVNQKIKQSFLTGPSMLSNAGMYPQQQNDLEKMKIERLQYASAIFLPDNQTSNNQPLIGGLTKEAIVKVNIEGKKEKQNNLNLILAPFAAESDFTGKFSLTTEMLNTRVDSINGAVHQKAMFGTNEMMMDDGEYDYIIQLPKQIKDKKIQLESVRLQLNGGMIQYSILNRSTGEYLPIKDNQNTLTLKKEDQVENYFSKEGELLIKIQKHANGDPYVYLPTITVKGEVTP